MVLGRELKLKSTQKELDKLHIINDNVCITFVYMCAFYFKYVSGKFRDGL
jgi:hypothetical protein